VAETSTHYFVHYAVFHPRDYKGGERKGAILSELIREGARRGGKYDPTGLADETALAHENDLEGCLVVASKHGSELGKARVVFVETLHHNEFSSYVTSAESAGFSTVSLSGNSPLLYIEPKGHGIQALSDAKQNAQNNFLVYKFAGRADDPEKIRQGDVGYDLLPIQSTLWAKAVAAKKINDLTYGSVTNYRTITINVVANGGTKKRTVPVGSIGATFLGKVGGLNMARPPWGWFDRKNREQPLGQWFFDPATVTKRNFKLGESFSTVYTVAPFWARGGK
jgi:hypothetical protein